MSVAVEGRSTLRQSLFEQNERFQKLVDLIPTSLYTHKPVYLQQKQKWTKHNGDDRSKKQKPKQKEARKDKSKVAPAENVRMDMDDNLPVHKVQTNGSSANLSRQEIRDKLHAKIASFASERNAPAPAQITASSAPSPAPSTSTGGKQALIAQAQAEKKARLEDSKKRKKEERKQRQKALQKALKEAEGDERPSEDSKGKGKARMDVDVDQEAASDAWVDVTADSSLVVARPNRSDGVDMPVDAVDFSHLDFTDQATVKPVDLLPGHSRKTKSKVSQEQAALDRIEQRKKFLDKIGQQSRERAEEKDRWQKAETRIEGGKVLDEEKRLRKMAKRKEKAKEDSRREWCVFPAKSFGLSTSD